MGIRDCYIESGNREDFDTAPVRGDENRKSSISYYRIGDLIFGVDGVADIISYTLNGQLASLTSGYEEYFTLEEVETVSYTHLGLEGQGGAFVEVLRDHLIMCFDGQRGGGIDGCKPPGAVRAAGAVTCLLYTSRCV